MQTPVMSIATPSCGTGVRCNYIERKKVCYLSSYILETISSVLDCFIVNFVLPGENSR